MRSILVVAEMSVLSRIGDAVAVRSLVAGREPDFLRCSANLLRYCMQVLPLTVVVSSSQA